MEQNSIIPIFFSVNDAYVPYLSVALNSLKTNASKKYSYHIHILNDDISASNRKRLLRFSEKDFKIEFIPLTETMESIKGVSKLKGHQFEAFSSPTIYFRLFIPVLFPQYDKAIYLDSDIVVPGDISKLWETELEGNLIGACADYSIQHIAPFMHYIDTYVGVDHKNYVNSGVLLMNLKHLREVDIAGRFISWMEKYRFEAVAPDQDYINALCWNSIKYLDPSWDTMPSDAMPKIVAPQIIHFNLDTKPWLNEWSMYHDVFWEYALCCGYEKEIIQRRDAFLKDPLQREKYENAIAGLIKLAAKLSEKKTSFNSIISSRKEFRLCS